jgi:hypothetical protein
MLVNGVRRPTVGSLFSGIGGIDLGFEAAGFETAWQCEIEDFPRRILVDRFPRAALYSDIKAIGALPGNREAIAPVDVMVGGFPCQDLSLAGRRKGLSGERSGLFFEFTRIIREMREATDGRFPRCAVFENVVGLLSQGGGRDFAAVLNELAECGSVEIGYRVIDAQHWVPQRRRRVFIVASFPSEIGGCSRVVSAGKVLFDTKSGGRNIAESGKAGEDVAFAPTASVRGSGGGATGNAHNSTYVTGTLGVGRRGYGIEAACAGHYVADIVPQAMSSKWSKGSSGPAGDEHHNLVVAPTLQASAPDVRLEQECAPDDASGHGNDGCAAGVPAEQPGGTDTAYTITENMRNRSQGPANYVNEGRGGVKHAVRRLTPL